MDISSLRKGTLKAWIPVEHEEEVFVQCKYISQSKWEELKAAATEITIDDATGKQTERFDPVKFYRSIGQFAVADVRGLTDGVDDQEQPLPFQITPENIDMLMDNWSEFRLAVMTSPLGLSRMIRAELEETKKKS